MLDSEQLAAVTCGSGGGEQQAPEANSAWQQRGESKHNLQYRE